MKDNPSDEFRETRVAEYDGWLKDGRIPFSSRVVTVAESIEPEQQISNSERALEILSKARTIALQKCECREHYRRCHKPLEVCFTLDDIGDSAIKEGSARRVSLEEAAAVLKKAHHHGLVHLSLYRPDHRVFAPCNCCPCYCHDLRILKQHGRKDLVVRAEAVAVTDLTRCKDCGMCVERCYFEARTLKDETMTFDRDRCYGCGLCVSSCPQEAISMQRRSP